jgi:hypothetical protein
VQSQLCPAALPCHATAPPPAPDGQGPYRLLRRAPLRSFSYPHVASRHPLLFPRRPAHRALSKAATTDLAPLLPVFLLRPLCAPPPPRSPTEPIRVVPRRLTASPQGDRATAGVDLPPPPPTLGEPGPPCVVAHKWRVPHLLPLLRCCRTPPPVPPVIGVPPPTWDIAALPPLRPRTSSRCSGEPSPPPSRCSRRRFWDTLSTGAHRLAVPPRTWPLCGDHAVSASGVRPAPSPRANSTARPGRQAVAQLAGQSVVHGRPPSLAL